MSQAIVPPPWRILSLDGGGVYGLFTALMLKQLCLKNPEFLTSKQTWLLAGTSSGAVNSLLMAKYDSPRQAILSGELEAFWKEAGIYTNDLNPWEGWLSTMGFSSLLGTHDFMQVLRKYFGNLTLGELRQQVLITTFNWAGDRQAPIEERHWKTKIFFNFPETELDRSTLIVDVAFAAGAAPIFRGIHRGFQDGGIFAPNPSMCAIAKAMEFFQKTHDQINQQWRDTILMIQNACQQRNALLLDQFDEKIKNKKNWVIQLQTEVKKEIQEVKRLHHHLHHTLKPEKQNLLLNFEQSLQNLSLRIEELEEIHQKQEEIEDLEILTLLREIILLSHREFDLLHEISQDAVLGRHYQVVIPALQKKLEALEKLDMHCAVGRTHRPLREDSFENLFVAYLEEVAITLQDIHERAQMICDLLLYSSPQEILSDLKMLSVGTGTKKPFLWAKDANWGMAQWMLSPSNPLTNHWFSPLISVMLDGPEEDTNFQCKQFLNSRQKAQYHRLNPHVLSLPCLMALIFCKNPLGRASVFQMIEQAMLLPPTQAALAAAEAWIQSDWQ